MDEKEKSLRNIWSFLKDLWQFIKKYYTPDPDPCAPYWAQLISEANALGEKHKGRLQWNLINAFLDYLDNKEYETQKEKQA